MRKLFFSLLALVLSCCAVNAQGVPGLGMGVPVNGPGVQVNLSATVAPTVSNDSSQGYAVGSLWQNQNTGDVWIARSVSAGAAVWDRLGISDFYGYVAGRWYIPFGMEGTVATGSAPGQNSIRLFPVIIKQRVTLSALGSRIGTASAGGNVQFAIYANNSATNLPTGNALASTASISTTSTGSISGSVSVQLNPGLYWFASNADNATVSLNSINVASFNVAARIIGSATQANLFAAQTLVGTSVAQTFGTWPDLTSGSFTDVTGSTMPVILLQVGSVP